MTYYENEHRLQKGVWDKVYLNESEHEIMMEFKKNMYRYKDTKDRNAEKVKMNRLKNKTGLNIICITNVGYTIDDDFMFWED